LTGLYGTSATCSSKTGQVYASSYDSWGNVTSRTYNSTTATLTYDLLDHFVSWNAGSQSKDLSVYDASGNRVLRRTTTSSGTTMTVYAFGLEEHTYFNAGGHKGDLYYYSLGGRLLGALDNTGKTSFYLTDALGSVLASFNNVANSAALKGNQVYGPYGNPRDFQGTINTAKGFTGQYSDSVSGLDYYNSRYYDQVAGVFLSADTVPGNGSGENPYGYVGGDPETYTDPSGQMPCAGPGGPCSWPTTPSGGTGSAASAAVNYVAPSLNPPSNNQPTCVLGCVAQLRAQTPFPLTVTHQVNTTMPTIACYCICFITIATGQTSVPSKIFVMGESAFTTCGLSPLACSGDNGQGGEDTGVSHDMPDVSAADIGGGEPGNAGEIDSSSQGESGDLAVLPKQAQARAVEIRDTMVNNNGWWFRREATVGVAYMQDGEGVVQSVVAINESALAKWGSDVQNLLGPEEHWIEGDPRGEIHPEVLLKNYATDTGQTIVGIGASTGFCTACKAMLLQEVGPEYMGQ